MKQRVEKDETGGNWRYIKVPISWDLEDEIVIEALETILLADDLTHPEDIQHQQQWRAAARVLLQYFKV